MMVGHNRKLILWGSTIGLILVIGFAIYTYTATRSPAFIGIDITPVMCIWLGFGLIFAFFLLRALFSDKWAS
jgi:hypothetical protein